MDSTPEEIADARVERNQAWINRMMGRISQAELFEAIRATRGKHGQAIYEYGTNRTKA